jgi:hypothetical protein
MCRTKRRWLWPVALQVGVLACLPAPAVASDERVAHLRIENDRVREVVGWATGRSAAFRQLVTTIEGADIVVYVNHGSCRNGALRSCLLVMPTLEQRRVAIYVDSRQSLRSVAAQMAHEFEHAIEIAGDGAARDAPSVRSLFERIGFANCVPGLRPCWETRAAQEREKLVWRETLDAPHGRKLVTDETYFGTWRLDVEQSTFQEPRPPRESTRIIRDRGFGLTSTVIHSVDAAGNIDHRSFVSRPDGERYLMSGPGEEPKVTITEELLNSTTANFVIRSDRYVIATGTRSIVGGRDMTITVRSFDECGQEITSTTVWKKVEHE